MDAATLFYLMGAVAIGCYAQAVTGFAFGLIFVGVVSVAQLIDLKTATLIVSILAVINTVFALKKAERHTDWRLVGATLILSIPMVWVGYWLLDFLSQDHVSTLRPLLGGVIIASSLVLIFPPKPGKAVSSLPVFSLFGMIAGLLGGLFSTSGPPLIFQFYRQNLPIAVIRDCLLAIFAVSAATRTGLAIALDGLPDMVWIISLLAFPVTMGATWLGKHYPPKVSDTTMRRIAAGLLILTASNLIVT